MIQYIKQNRGVDMKIGILGLGLIGGTIAKTLNGQHIVSGYDISQDSVDYALGNKIIHNAYTDIRLFLEENDVVYLCLYPENIINFIFENNHIIPKNSVLIEISGVKRTLIEEIRKLGKLDFEIIYTHPIAGREKVGIRHSDTAIFKNANYVITPVLENSKTNIELAKKLAIEMGFKHVSIVTPEEHDQMIAYTSQLTHVLSISLVNALSTHLDTSRFIGDSYRDLTRISMINEHLWPELFLMNRDSLLKEIADFSTQLKKIRTAIIMNNKDDLANMMIMSTRIRKKISDGEAYDD